MSDHDTKFDPRFDPAFQRGYDGPAPSATPRGQSVGRQRVESPPEPIIGAPPRFTPAAYDHGTPLPPSAVVAEPAGAGEIEDAPRSLNPFLIGLAAVGIALIVLGLVLLTNLESLVLSASNEASQTIYYFMQVIMIAAPIISSLGAATLIGVLFVLAVRWRPRP